MMRRSLRAAGLGRQEAGASSSDHQDPVSPPIAPPSWVPDPPAIDTGKSAIAIKLNCKMRDLLKEPMAFKVNLLDFILRLKH